MKHEYWKHMSSGEVYAVMVGKDERAVIAAGPLRSEEVTAENLRECNFNYEDDLEDWLNENPDDFGLHEIEEPAQPLTTSDQYTSIEAAIQLLTANVLGLHTLILAMRQELWTLNDRLAEKGEYPQA